MYPAVTRVFVSVFILLAFATGYSDSCVDRLLNCNAFNTSMCGHYPLWAKHNCPKFCGVCPCPDGWSYYKPDRTCMKDFGKLNHNERLRWDDAKSRCMSYNGGNLVQIRDNQKNRFTVQIITSNMPSPDFYQFWIGVRNVAEEPKVFNFRYVDGTPLMQNDSFPDWLPENPDDTTGFEKCVSVYIKKGFYGQWNDFSCGHVRPFVCTIPAFQ